MKKGFTLIELLIVIVIIGILAVAFLPTALNAPKRARDAQRKAHLQAIIQAVETYGLDQNGSYPTSQCLKSGSTLDSYFRDQKPPSDPSNLKIADGDPFRVNGASPVCGAGEYYFFYDSSAGCYAIIAKMEDTKSGNAAKNANVTCSAGLGTSGEYFVIRNNT